MARCYVRLCVQRAAIALSAMFLVQTAAEAQLPQTRFQALYPPGGQQGQTFDVTIASGTDLDEVSALTFSDPRIKAEQKFQESGGVKQPVTNAFTVTIGADVEPGLYEARVAGLYGLSNPRLFAVTSQPCHLEKEANNTREQALELPLEQSLFGQINGRADLDFAKFQGKAGQTIVVQVAATELDSILAAAIELSDANGNRLTFARRQFEQDPVIVATLPSDGEYFVKVHDFVYGGGTDYFYQLKISAGPYVAYVFPPAVQPGVKQAVELYGYNLPGGQPTGAGALQRVPMELQLPANLVEPAQAAQARARQRLVAMQSLLDVATFRFERDGVAANQIPVMLANHRVLTEQTDLAEGASQRISVPCEVAGRFEVRSDVDSYEFEAASGEVYYIEVIGHRLSGRLDPKFTLEQLTLNEDGTVKSAKRLVVQDDGPPNLGGNDFNTLSDDPLYRLQVPADGRYRIRLWDLYGNSRGGDDLVYRLIVRREQPQYRLVALGSVTPTAANQPYQPGAVVLRRGENCTVRVMAYRQDGFDQVIRLKVEGLPKGVTATGGLIGASETATSVVLQAAEDAAIGAASIRILGDSEIDDLGLRREIAAIEKQLAAVEKKRAATDKPVTDAQANLTKAQAPLDAAQKKSAADPDNATLKKQVEGLQKTVDAARAALEKAQAAQAAAQAEVDGLRQQLQATREKWNASKQQVVRQARAAGVVWPGSTTTRAIARLQRNLRLSVIAEAAPVQVVIKDVDPVQDVTAGQQLLLPVELAKRNKFDNNVALAMQGIVKNSKITPENKTINKGKNSETIRLAIDKSAPEGSYTLYLQSTVQVPYVRNPQRVERATAEATKKAEELKAADAKLKTITATHAEQKKKTDALKVQLDAAAKAAAPIQAAIKTQQQQVKTAETVATKAAAAVKQQEQEVAKQKAARDAAVQKSAADAKNEELKKAATEAENQLKQSEAKLVETKKTADAAQAEVAKANELLKQTTQQLAENEALQKKLTAEHQQAAAALAKLDSELTAATAAQKSATAAKTAADKELTAAKNAAKPKNTNYLAVSTPLLVTVHKAPVEVTASVADGGKLKRGGEVETTVKIKRVNGFTGAVQLGLGLPPGTKGLTAESTQVPADATEAKLKLKANGEATEGQIKYLTIRATTEFEGRQATVDAPVNLTVSK